MSAIDAPAPPPTAAPVDAIMNVQDVVKIFGGLTAVGGVSLDIPRRSIVSVIGPNGAGKTTLFNMLTGLYKPTSGRILFDGQRDQPLAARTRSPSSALRARSRTSACSAR